MYTQWIDLLAQTNLFTNVSKDELAWMLNCIQPPIETYEPKKYFDINKNNFSGVGIILEGKVALVKDNLVGDRVIISQLSAGEIFGSTTAFSAGGTLATIKPLEKTTILFLPADKIVGVCPELCAGHEMLIRNMLKITAEEALHLNEKVEVLSLNSIKARISNYLLHEHSKEQALTFTIPLKRYELAEFLNIPRPSLSRELKNMKDAGIIDFHRNSFKILDLAALQKCLSA